MGDEALAEERMVWAIRASLEGEGTQVVTWEQVQLEASADDVCRSLVQMIRDGFLEEKVMMEDLLKPFFGMREELNEVEDVPFLHGKMLIPVKLRPRVLEILHQAHQGVVGMKAKTRQSFWWPGKAAAIDQKCAQCRNCNVIMPSNH